MDLIIQPFREVSILTDPARSVQRKPSFSAVGTDAFQSSPTPQGRCNVDCKPVLWGEKVSILTDPARSVQLIPPGACFSWWSFQSSPTPQGRCNLSRYVIAGLCT